MRVTCQTFWLQKANCSPDEYEDAFAPKDTNDLVADSFRCAVADGATETSFAALWAQLLVESYVNGERPLKDLQQAWKDKTSNLELAWYAEQKLESGAFAALVGLNLSVNEGQGKWEAKALGDSCLFHVRGKELLVSLPLTKWEDFNTNPLLIASVQSRNESFEDQYVTASGAWEPGDCFYLMSDAISCWFLRCYEQSQDTTSHVADLINQSVFEDVVNQQREATDESGNRLMKNDDVTLMRVLPSLS